MKKIISSLLIFFLTVSQCFAVTGVPANLNWVRAGHGGGGNFSMIYADHHVAGKYYAIPDIGYPYVTTDSGESWDWLVDSSTSGFHAYNISAFIQSVNNANLMWVHGGGGQSYQWQVLKSSDGGKNWEIKSNAACGNRNRGNKSLALDPSDDNTIWVSCHNGHVMRSTNGGDTWANVFKPFLRTITGESAELNGSGQTRTGKTNNVTNLDPGSFVFTSSGETFNDNGDGTLTGTAGGSGTINYSNGNYSLTFFGTPSTTTVTYQVRSTANFIYVTPDGGKVFAGNKTFAGGGRGLVYWDVGGETLVDINLEPTTVSSYAVYNDNVGDFATYIDGSMNEVLCVPAGIQVACTDDEAATWTYTADVTTPATSSSNAYYIARLAVKRLGSGQIRYVVGLLKNANDSSSGAFTRSSSDSGATWATSTFTRNTTINPVFVTASSGTVRSITASPDDEDEFFFSNNGIFYRSDNGGASFTEKDEGAQIIVANRIRVAPNGWLIKCGMDMGCQKSEDFGDTWENLIPKYPWTEPGVPYPGGHYWEFLLHGTKTEWDNGQGKMIVTSHYWYSEDIGKNKPRVHYSTDSLETFTTSDVGLPGDLRGDTIWSNGYARALTSNEDGSVIYLGMDGETCQRDNTLPLNCTTNYGTGGIFKSTDYGATWTQIVTTPRKIYNALLLFTPTDTGLPTLIAGTFSYNGYKIAPIEDETAELTGSGSTRTGTLNYNKSVVMGSVVITDAGGEIFTDEFVPSNSTGGGTGTLTSNLGGTGTIGYYNGAYTLNYAGTPSTATADYQWRTYVGDDYGPSNYIFDAAKDSEEIPYMVGQGFVGADAAIYQSTFTNFGPANAGYGTWKLIHQFPSSSNTIGDGLLIDPRNDNRAFMSTVNCRGGTVDGCRVYVTVDLQNGANSTWYDITGNMRSMGGCNSLAINYFEGDKGYLYCSSASADILKLSLDDVTTGLVDGIVINAP